MRYATASLQKAGLYPSPAIYRCLSQMVKDPPASSTDTTTEHRYNAVNIQMLPASLHEKLFPDCRIKKNQLPSAAESELTSLSQEHLKKHGIPYTERRPALPSLVIPNMPTLLGGSIEDHFRRLGLLIGGRYRNLAEEFAFHPGVPEKVEDMKYMEGKWSSQPGWTRYARKGGEMVIVDQIGPHEADETVIVLDVETCKSFGPWPLMAVAMSVNFLYSWVSPHLFTNEKGEGKMASLSKLIPLDSGADSMLVIGHNVSYDRARLVSEYQLLRGNMRFLDTLSMHCAVSGLSSQQRGLWKSNRLSSSSEDDLTIPFADGIFSSSEDKDPQWCKVSSMNNLADAVRLHCGEEMDKSPRDILVKGTINDVRDNFQKLMTYCANDVSATRSLFAALWPKFLKKCPHPVTLAALLEMGSAFLPVNESWSQYITQAETLYQQSIDEIEKKLRQLVEDIAIEGGVEDRWKTDPWLVRLDWTPVPGRYTKERRKVDGTLAKGGESRPIGNTALFGKPAWYKKLWSSKLGGPQITAKTRILPYLLRLEWDGFPVHFLEEHGWCFVTPFSLKLDSYKEVKVTPPDPQCRYYRIPHEEDESANVGSLMSKSFLKYYETGKLKTKSLIMKEIMNSATAFSFWIGYRERIREQLVIWEDEPGCQLGFKSGERAGLVLPGIITMGTVTRRAVEPTWMTASNPKKTLVGSELKCRIVAPKGYIFVGADVDSQELWISSLLGDAQFGFAGATPLGWMTLQGTKSDGTDLHSRTAAILGMSRDSAKIFNYGRIYGAGRRYAAQLLQKFNPTMSKGEAEEKARQLYETTKGKTISLGDRKMYIGGTESFMFNELEAIANSSKATTPALSASISDALISGNVGGEYLTSRVNWAVQSSGVDYLHMLLVSVAYLSRVYNIDMRLSLTIHDEVRFLAKEEDQYRAALALQIANCWTRTMFARRVGMSDLPFSVAFFSAIDLDRVLRKEVSMDCITPSNTNPIPPGQALDIYKLLKFLPNGLGPVDPQHEGWTKFTIKLVDQIELPAIVHRAQTRQEFELIRRQIGLLPSKSKQEEKHASSQSGMTAVEIMQKLGNQVRFKECA